MALLRALVKFDISDNQLGSEGTKPLAEALTGNTVMTELNISKNDMTYVSGRGYEQMAGVSAMGDAIPTMRALTSLNLASNFLGAEGAKHVAKAIQVHVSALPFD
jgi:Ran GTPase-activating protein (RanGAP) involved in mRNA processing and transport